MPFMECNDLTGIYFRPYLGERDPVMSLKFSKDHGNPALNIVYYYNPFRTSNSPSSDYIGFVLDLYRYLKRYQMPSGPTKEQYRKILNRHFSSRDIDQVFSFPPSQWLSFLSEKEYWLDCRARDYQAHASFPACFHAGRTFAHRFQLIEQICSTPVGKANFTILICGKVTRTHAISSFPAQFDLTGVVPPNTSSDMCKKLWIHSMIK